MRTLIVVLLAIVVVLITGSIMIRNDLVRQENSIEAVNKDLQNVHTSVFSQMRQQGVAVSEYGQMVIDAINVAISGRYGISGSQAAFHWIQEQNPSIPPEVMEKLQVAIEAGYNKFEARQRDKIDMVRVYKNKLQVFPTNLVAGLFGFPRIDMTTADQVIISTQTERDFESGKLSDPEIFPEK